MNLCSLKILHKFIFLLKTIFITLGICTGIGKLKNMKKLKKVDHTFTGSIFVTCYFKNFYRSLNTDRICKGQFFITHYIF